MAAPVRGADSPTTLFIHAGPRDVPAWVREVGATVLSADHVQPGAPEGAGHLRAAGCVLLDAGSTDFVALARRVHAIDAAVQVVAVAPAETTQAARRALLYTPGLGEVWIASPTEVNAALSDRATGVTRQRRRFEKTRQRLGRDQFTVSPQRTERALISDAYLASLLRVLPDAVFSVDASGRVLSANAAAGELFGRDNEIVGARLDDVLRLASAPAREVAGLLRVAADGHAEVQFRTATGELRTGELRASAHHVQHVEVWAVVLRDVTEYNDALEQARDAAAELEAANEELQVTTEELSQRTAEAERTADALRESELSFRALADAIPTLAWTARADGYVDWYNRRWFEYTGTTPEAMAGSGWQAVHDPAVLPEVQRQFEAAIGSGQPMEMTFPLRGADGRYRAFLTRMVPVTDTAGRIIRWFGTNTDVQAQHEARAAAEEARERADDANRAKSQFLANMSHELRTPLNAIAGHIQLLEMELHGPLTEEQRTALARVKRAQEHLLGLINDVLNFAKLESGRVEYVVERLAVGDTLADVAPLMEPQFAAHGIAFTVERSADGATVCADRDKVRQVMLNLLSNAAKFTPAGGHVSVAYQEHDDRFGAIVVTDDDPGIPAERRESVFEPFVQLRAAYGASSEGTGLGLAISRDLARGMGGDLFVDQTPGGGSTFVFLLPRAP